MVDNCKICGSFIFAVRRPHVCPPRFDCRLDEPHKSDIDWHDIYAPCAETAAEKFAEQYDRYGDYTILQAGDRGDYKVEVRDKVGTCTYWSIQAESVPHYYADQITAADE